MRIAYLPGVAYAAPPKSSGPDLPWPPQLIVMHKTDNTGDAFDEAINATHRTDGTSSHFYVDEWRAIGSALLTKQAHGCHPTGNRLSWQVEDCGFSGTYNNADVLAAGLVRELCALGGIPAVKVTPEQMRAGWRGICGHDDVVAAWGEGNHTDPAWTTDQWTQFILDVRGTSTTMFMIKATENGPTVFKSDGGHYEPLPDAGGQVNAAFNAARSQGIPFVEVPNMAQLECLAGVPGKIGSGAVTAGPTPDELLDAIIRRVRATA